MAYVFIPDSDCCIKSTNIWLDEPSLVIWHLAPSIICSLWVSTTTCTPQYASNARNLPILLCAYGCKCASGFSTISKLCVSPDAHKPATTIALHRYPLKNFLSIIRLLPYYNPYGNPTASHPGLHSSIVQHETKISDCPLLPQP